MTEDGSIIENNGINSVIKVINSSASATITITMYAVADK